MEIGFEDFSSKWSNYRRKAAEAISHHIGRLYRGKVVRRMIQHFKWFQFNNAAKVIQKMYRIWKNSQSFRIMSAISYRSRIFHKSKITTVNPLKCFQKALVGGHSEEDKIVMWRVIVDLRRAFPTHTIESCIKAILEAKGDKNRAKTLLGLPAFSVREYADLPKDIKQIFLPNFNYQSFSRHVSRLDRPKSASSVRTNVSGFQGIRSLKSQKYQPSANKLDSDIAKALEVVFFSQQPLVGNHPSKKFKRIYAPSNLNADSGKSNGMSTAVKNSTSKL